MVRIRTSQTASPGGSWLRAAQTDEGRGAPNICFAVSIMLPAPHPALRATFPQGKAFFGVYLPISAGKIQENRSGFLGRFKGV